MNSEIKSEAIGVFYRPEKKWHQIKRPEEERIGFFETAKGAQKITEEAVAALHRYVPPTKMVEYVPTGKNIDGTLYVKYGCDGTGCGGFSTKFAYIQMTPRNLPKLEPCHVDEILLKEMDEYRSFRFI